jgi:hypothetical protein
VFGHDVLLEEDGLEASKLVRMVEGSRGDIIFVSGGCSSSLKVLGCSCSSELLMLWFMSVR